MWTLKSSTDTTLELEMAPSDYTKEMWDKEFLCTFSVSLEADQLKTNMLVNNVGSEDSFDFQAALHSYFTVSSLENLEITGSFEGKEFLNKLVGDGGEMQTEDRSAITISEEYDRVYKGVNDPVLKDSGVGKAVSETNIPYVSKQLKCLTVLRSLFVAVECHQRSWMGRYRRLEPIRRRRHGIQQLCLC